MSLPHPEQSFIAIGDIHGQHDRLVALWAQLKRRLPDFDMRAVVFLGDYVNRGPKIMQTIEFLSTLQKTRPNTHFLCGNHDHALISFLWPPSVLSRFYLSAGSGSSVAKTFESYGAQHNDRASMLKQMPEHHQTFLRSLKYVHTMPGFIFVHGGLSEDKSVAEQLLFLQRGAAAKSKPRQIFEHEEIYSAPSELLGSDTCLISGHHGFVHFEQNRVVCDQLGARRDSTIECFVYPEFMLFNDEGRERPIDPAAVFPHRVSKS